MSLYLCRLTDIPDGEGKGFELNAAEGEELEIFVVRRGEKVFGYLNSCPHIGTPLNWEDDRFMTMDKSQILCATLGATFRIEDGHCTSGPCTGLTLGSVKINCGGGEISLSAEAYSSVVKVS